MTTDSTNTAKAQYFHATNTTLSSINELSYYTKQVSGPSVADPSFQLPVCLNGITNGNCSANLDPSPATSFSTLVYEPYQNGTIVNNTWQQWDVDAGLFYSTRTIRCSNGTITGGAGGPAMYTLNDIKTACPDAVVFQFGLNVGTNNPSYNVETDLFDFNGTVYDFEPDSATILVDDDGAATTTDCSMGTPGSASTTIQGAIDSANPGDTIKVCPGLYPETLNINKQLTILGAQAGVLAKPRNDVSAESTIVVGYSQTPPVNLQTDNITFNGFNFDINGTNPSQNGSDKPGSIIVGNGNPGGDGYQNINILYNRLPYSEANVDLPSQNRTGFFMFYANNLLVEGNYFAGFPGQAVIVANGSNNFTYRNNDSFNNADSNVGTQGNFGGPTTTLDHTNVLIENNRSDQDSMILFLLKNSTIRNNTLTAGPLGSSRVYLGGGSNNVSVATNTFTLTNNTGLVSFDPFGYGPNSNINFTDNTLMRNADATTTGSFSAIDYRGTGGNNLIDGNTVRITGTLPTNNSTYAIRIRGSASGNFTITNNSLNGGNTTTTGTTMPRTSGLYITSNAAGTTGDGGLLPASSVINASCNTFANFQDGITVYDSANGTTGSLINGSNIHINNNNIIRNAQFGINNGGTSATIDATGNYWNAPDGPGPVGPGSGDRVTTNVDFSGFLTSPPVCAPPPPPAAPRFCGSIAPPYNVVTEFSLGSNPNCEFSYGNTANSTPDSTFTLYPFASADEPVAGIDRWHRDNPDPDLVPAVIKNRNATTTTYFSVAHPADELNLHPGQNGERSVVRFTAPSAGNYQINGQFEGIDNNGTTSDVLILKRPAGGGVSNQLFAGDLNFYQDTEPFAIPFVTLAAGDIIDFSVGYGSNQSYGSDSTGLRATIMPSETVRPSVTVTPATGTFTTSPITFTFMFSEPVTGFEMSDISVTNGTKSNFTGSGSIYTIDVTPMSDGTVTVSVPDSAAMDAAMNTSTASNTASVTYDGIAPTVTINQASGQPDPTTVSPINFTVVFSEPVTGFDASDVTLTGTAIASVGSVTTTDNQTFNVPVNVTSSGTVTATIAANRAQDASGNPNSASTSMDNTVTFFTTATAMVVDDDGMASPGNCDASTPAPNKIQTAIDLATAGDTIMVCPGTYDEELNIDKALTLLGPNANVNPNTGTRTDEAIIVPTTVGNPVDPNFAGPLVVFLGADGITFRGFTVDGNNPALTSGVVFNGEDVDAEFGIYGTQTANPDAVINNNIVQNIGEIAVWLTSNNVGGPKDANSSIFDNKVDNVLGAFGQAIRISDGAWVDVKTNVVTRSRLGITIENYYPGNSSETHPASEISDNNVTAFRIGIRHNLHYNYVAPGFTIRHNTVNSYVQAVRPPQVTATESSVDRYQGIRLESIQNGVAVNVLDNILTGNRAAMMAAGYTEDSGLYVTNSSTNSANMLLTGNSVTDFIRGANNETPAIPTFSCNNFFGNTTGVYLSSAATNGLTATNNNIIGNGFGMQNDGSANVNAQSNYWGAANGPGPVGPGNGDQVSTNVDFSNFLTTQATCAVVVSKTFPTVTIEQVGPDPTNTSPINFTVTFSEAVTGFDGSDVVLSGTAGATTAVVTGSGTTYNVAVSGMTSNGTVIAMVRVAAAQSVATNSPTSASTSVDNTVTYDTVSPTVTVSPTAGQPDPTNSTVSFTIVFSEPTTNFTQGDVTVTNGTITSFTGSGTTYTVVVTPTATGPVTAMVAAGVATDAAGNPNTASNTASVNFDGTNPTVTVNQAAGQADPTGTSPINFTVVFSEPVTGFGDAASDVTISGTAFGVGSNPKAVVTGNGTTYNVAVSGMNQTGTVSIALPAGAAVDNVGNPNNASTSTDNTVTFNLIDTPVTVNPTNTNTAGITMWGGFDDNTNQLTPPSYFEGPPTPPAGTGSARLNTTANGKYLFFSTYYNGTPLSQITELSYGAYANDPSNQANLPSLQIGIDYDSADTNTGFQGRLVFVPADNQTPPNQAIVPMTWQRWNATNGRFFATQAPGDAMCPQSNPCSLATILATYPRINIPNNANGGIGFRSTGGGTNAVENYVDKFTVGVNSANTTFNFEAQPPTISIGNMTVTEGNSGTTAATFTITQSVVSQLATTVTINTADGSATTADNDYQAIVNGTATIPAGQNSTTVTVNVKGDTNVEGNETFTVNLSNAVNAAIVTAQGIGTINNDDVVISFSTPTYNVNEGGGTATITVIRNGVTPNPVSINYATSSGSATGGSVCTAGVDFINTSGTLTFAGNDTSKTFTVTICDDNISEPTNPETVNLTLSGVTGGAMLGTASAVLNIADNDGGGIITISGTITQNGGGGLDGVTVTLNNGSTTQTTLTSGGGNYSFTNQTSGNDFLITPSCVAPTCSGYVFDPINRNYDNLMTSVSNANFTAFVNNNTFPRNLRVVNGYQSAAGQPIAVPIIFTSQGGEAEINFRLNFGSTLLSFVSLNCGNGFTCTSNSTPGQLDVSVEVTGAPLTAGMQYTIATINFNRGTNTTASNAALTFDPNNSSTSDANANLLLTSYTDGFAVFAQGFEADVENRFTGNGQVNTADIQTIRLFSVGSLTPNPNFNEFQRADCAPLATSGDGRIDTSDIQRARIYSTGGVANYRPAAGPSQPIPPPAMNIVGILPNLKLGAKVAAGRNIRVQSVSGSAGQTVTVIVRMDADGTEQGVGFTINYDSTKLLSATVVKGSAATSAVLTQNLTNDGNTGRIGLGLDFGNATIAAGNNLELLRLTFTVDNSLQQGQSTTLSFTDDLAFRSVNDINGEPLPNTTYTNGTVSNFLAPTASSVTVGGKVRNTSGRPVNGAIVTLTDSAGNINRVRTNAKGIFRFDEVRAGETYILNATFKGYSFTPQIITVMEDLANVDLIMQE